MTFPRIHNLWGAAKALRLAQLADASGVTLVVAPNPPAFETLLSDIAFFMPDRPILSFPPYTQDPFEMARVLPAIIGNRMRALHELRAPKPGTIVVTTPYGIAKKVPPPDVLDDAVLLVKAGTVISRDELAWRLDILGYVLVELVSGPGEYTVRGEIAEIFPVHAESAVRVEFFDDEVEALSSYDIETRASLTSLESVILLPADELVASTDDLRRALGDHPFAAKIETYGRIAGAHWLAPMIHEPMVSLFDYLPDTFASVMVDVPCRDIALDMDTFAGTRAERAGVPVKKEDIFVSSGDMCRVLDDGGILADIAAADSTAAEIRSTKNLFAFEKKNIYHSLAQSADVLRKLVSSGVRVVLAVESDRFADLLVNFLKDYEIFPPVVDSVADVSENPGISLHRTKLTGGFVDPDENLAVICDEDIFGFTRRKSRKAKKEIYATTIADLEAGDYVVHVDYGIGIYRGLTHKTIGDIAGDYLEIEYEGNDILYVPLEGIGQIQKYIGAEGQSPRIHSLRSAAWARVKREAKRTAKKIAQDLLKLYAERKVRKGIAFHDDGVMLAEFEQTFPYEETEDQVAAIYDVFQDMEADSPMDRLVCGDVGFGKTEIAMRAAAKAVACGKQVAVLVPTTVLARQHYERFHERFADLPVNVDFFSRFKSPGDVRKTLADVSLGKVDILIGTHRMLSKDLQFKDIGLLVIDEEQRFGVAHKEKITALKSNIDVLAMSATPIPRTLQLSLSGIRDMSVIETPPADRLPVVTRVIKGNDEIKNALTRELERGGQAFFLHNRVDNIKEVAADIAKLMPDARIGIGHGQMTTTELENVLMKFYDGQMDILVCTTIIENGIDIPNANTIVVNNAGNFGLSQLYQLKGRVGRSKRRGHCALVVGNLKSLNEIAQKRLKIIQQLSDLGSGFKIAMYDLQLRGAGNILGAEQSGFIVKVGYELFISMIEDAVNELRGDFTELYETEVQSSIPYFIPADYVEDPRLRIDYYRRFARTLTHKEMREILAELAGIYGAYNEEVENLGHIMLIKNLAGRMMVKKLILAPRSAKATFAEDSNVPPLRVIELIRKKGLNARFDGEYTLTFLFGENMPSLMAVSDFFAELFSPAERQRSTT